MSGLLTRTGARLGTWLYRRTSGRIDNGGGPPRVLLLTTPGRRTGLPRSTCVASLHRDGAYIVWGTAGGAPHDPHWFRNLRAAGQTTVQANGGVFRAAVRELQGPEHDAQWAEIARLVKGAERYAAKAKRPIPVAVLTPIEE